MKSLFNISSHHVKKLCLYKCYQFLYPYILLGLCSCFFFPSFILLFSSFLSLSQPDDLFEEARTVPIRLSGVVGRHLRLKLHFQARWIMLSEVSFESGTSLALCLSLS